jgi:hypothetical protein
MKICILVSVVFLFFGCSTTSCNEKSQAAKPADVKSVKVISGVKEMSKVKVYKADGTLQCNQGDKISIDTMAKELTGITIYSKENKHDGLMRIQLCGKPTGNNHVFEIDETNLEKALSLGFKTWIR